MKAVRTAFVAATLVVTLVLTACAGLPTSGSVNPGYAGTVEESPPDFAYRPDGPITDATPQQIVEGFIAAGSGPRGNWEVAQEFLASGASEWRPQEGVTIYRPAELPTVSVVEGESSVEVTVTVTAAATVDASGAYSPTSNVEVPLVYTLEVVEGQWRITDAPDGIVLDSNRFRSVFRNYSLMYFDPTWTYLVPDERWFPASNPATRIAEALVEGSPSEWLSGAVATAFSDATTLAQPSVPVRGGGVAEVSLERGAVDVDQVVRDRMLTQLEASLSGTGVSSVSLLVDGQQLDAEPVQTQSTRIDSRPLVLTEDGFGFLSGESLAEPVEGLSALLSGFTASAIDVNPELDVAAVADGDGAIRRVAASGETSILDDRSNLIDPVIDVHDVIWAVPRTSPSALTAYTAGGAVFQVADAWPTASQIEQMRISRDGARVAAILREGNTYVVRVAGIVRDADSVPTSLTDSVVVATLPGRGTDLVWADATTLGILAVVDEAPVYIEQLVGGASTSTSAPVGATALAGTNQADTVRVLDAEGNLFFRRGSAWLRSASDILVLASQEGMPG